jgi:hypothetical protein
VPDAHSGALLDARGECDERAAQAELLQRSGSQATRDLAEVLDALSRGELDLCEVGVELGWDASGEAVELEADAGEDLAELVVQLAGEAASLAFLGGEGPPSAREPFALEAVEHLVEGVGEIGHLGHRTLDCDAAARLGGLDPTHEGGQVLERLEHAPQQRDVDAGTTTMPTPRTTSSVTVSVELTVAGERTRATVAANSRPVLMATTRQNKVTEPSIDRRPIGIHGLRSPIADGTCS